MSTYHKTKDGAQRAADALKAKVEEATGITGWETNVWRNGHWCISVVLDGVASCFNLHVHNHRGHEEYSVLLAHEQGGNGELSALGGHGNDGSEYEVDRTDIKAVVFAALHRAEAYARHQASFLDSVRRSMGRRGCCLKGTDATREEAYPADSPWPH